MSSPLLVISTIEHRLESVYPDALLRHQYAWWTIEHITGYNKATLLVQQDITLNEEQKNLLEQWMHALVIQKKPIQYLLGSVPFNGVTILVRPPILIPRPETEEWCIGLIQQLKPFEHQPL